MSKFLGFPEAVPSEEAFAGVEMVFLRPGKPGYYQAWKSTIFVDEPPETYIAQAKRQFMEEYWWLKKYWYEKGKPAEQFELTVQPMGVGLTISNFGEPLTDDHLSIMQRTFTVFAQGGEPIAGKLHSVTFDRENFQNPYSGEPVNGEAGGRDKMMWFSLRGRQFFTHRIPEANNFEGTLIHECAHVLARGTTIEEQWREAFGWCALTPARRLPGGDVCRFICNQPERCVTAYASLTPPDDWAESVVAALKAPERLYPEKLAFICQWFERHRIMAEVTIRRRAENETGFSPVPNPLFVGLAEHSRSPIVIRPSRQ